jgi:hypothetical protein
LDENEIDDNESCWDKLEDEEEEEEHRSSLSSNLSEESEQQHLMKSSENDVVVERKHTGVENSTIVSFNDAKLLQRSRREKLPAFAALNEQNIFDAIDYISEESIARAILAPCCRDECSRKKLNPISLLNFEGAYSKKYWRLWTWWCTILESLTLCTMWWLRIRSLRKSSLPTASTPVLRGFRSKSRSAVIVMLRRQQKCPCTVWQLRSMEPGEMILPICLLISFPWGL